MKPVAHTLSSFCNPPYFMIEAQRRIVGIMSLVSLCAAKTVDASSIHIFRGQRNAGLSDRNDRRDCRDPDDVMLAAANITNNQNERNKSHFSFVTGSVCNGRLPVANLWRAHRQLANHWRECRDLSAPHNHYYTQIKTWLSVGAL